MIPKKAKISCLSLVCCMVLALVLFQAPAQCQEFLIAIDVAPNVLNLQRTDDKCLTVHTNIDYVEVDASTVRLEVGESNISPYLCKSDLRGDFVAKFSMGAVRELNLEIDEYNTFTLLGATKGGDDFWGEQDIMVVDRLPKRR